MTTAIQTRAAARARTSSRAFWSALLPPLVVGVTIVVVWQAAVVLLEVPAYLLPAPSAIAGSLVTDAGVILSASRMTGLAVLGGMALGAVLGLIAAFLVSLAERVAFTVLGLVAVLSCAPVVALAPIFNQWFGASNLMSKIAVAAIMVFFPVMVNTARGLLRIDPLHRELMMSVSASGMQTMWWVRVPGALPALFDGLKIGSTLAVIGIIVSEYFGGTTDALGVLIANSAALSRFDQTWAAVAAASAMGLLLYGIVSLLGRVLAPWRQEKTS